MDRCSGKSLDPKVSHVASEYHRHLSKEEIFSHQGYQV
jgi:hypothetical protein